MFVAMFLLTLVIYNTATKEAAQQQVLTPVVCTVAFIEAAGIKQVFNSDDEVLVWCHKFTLIKSVYYLLLFRCLELTFLQVKLAIT